MEEYSKKNGDLALLGAAHSLNHSLFVITPPLLSLIAVSLGVTNFEIGLVSTVASLIYGGGALFGGPLGDRIGEVKAIAVCLALSGLPALLLLLLGFVNGFYVYAVTLVLMAVWASFYHPIANSLISKAFKVRVPEAMGMHGASGTLGVVLTPTVAWVIGAYFGWPWAFIFFGMLSVLLALAFARKVKRVKEPKHSKATILEALQIRELWMVLLVNTAIGLFMNGIQLFFPRYLQDNRGVSSMWASIAYTLLLTFGVLGQWIGGKTASTAGPKKVIIVTMAGICLALLSLLFLPVYIIGIAIFIALYGLCFFAHQPALNTLTGILAPQDRAGAVFGIYFFAAFGVGSVSQLFAGYIADVYGLDSAFYLLTLFAAVALLLSFKLPENTANEIIETVSPELPSRQEALDRGSTNHH